MKILTKDECSVNKDVILEVIQNGALFIHPTDTIYGIGCNATDVDAVDKIRDLKGRPEAPFSVIAPSKSWIKENCDIADGCCEWLDKLPGPYTLILKAKKTIAPNIAPGIETLGVRIPDNWFAELVTELDIPIVTTSANKVGENFMTSLDNLHVDISAGIEFIAYEGEKHGKPSQIVDLTGPEPIVKER